MTQPPNDGVQKPSGRPEDPTQPMRPYGQPPPAPTQPFPSQPEFTRPLPTQPVPGQPGQPFPGQPLPGAGQPGQPAFPPAVFPPAANPPAPKKRRGLLIASIVLAVVLLFCACGGVAAFLLLRDTATGEGAAEPVVAVDNFLKAIYTDKDAAKAAALVCSEARDEIAITKKVEEVNKYATTYDKPRFRWDAPKVDGQNAERAIVSAKIEMTTSDEKVAEQRLTFTVVQKTGWWVCEVG